MKIAFITSETEDYLQDTILHGLRSLLNDNCVDIPKKKIMYNDWSEKPRHTLHGRGFTLYSTPIDDIKNRDLENFDFILYGISNHPNDSSFDSKQLNSLVDANNIWYLDGHDLYGGMPPTLNVINHQNEIVIGVQRTPCFKRELIQKDMSGVYPIGFGIPECKLQKIDLTKKTQLIQKTAPFDSIFEAGKSVNGSHYIFNDEDLYYKDMQSSWFGLTCKKGGWDCMRHYEIMACGSLLLFKDYDKKPEMCSPIGIPTLSYSSIQELNELTNRLVVNNKPTEEYIDLLTKQREWLINNGTTTARAAYVCKILNLTN